MKKSIHVPKLFIFIFAFCFVIMMLHFAILLNFIPPTANGKVVGFLPGTQGLVDSVYTEAFPRHILKRVGEFNFHITLGLGFLILGVLQVSTLIRRKLRRQHRYIGILYLAVGTITVVTGCLLSIYSFGTFVTACGFYLAGIFWFYYTIRSLVSLYRGQYLLHGIQMAQGFAVALMPLPSRPIFLLLNQIFPERSLDETFPVAVWMSLVIGIVIAHWYGQIERSRLKSL